MQYSGQVDQAYLVSHSPSHFVFSYFTSHTRSFYRLSLIGSLAAEDSKQNERKYAEPQEHTTWRLVAHEVSAGWAVRFERTNLTVPQEHTTRRLVVQEVSANWVRFERTVFMVPVYASRP